LIHFGHPQDDFSVGGIKVYKELEPMFQEIKFGFVDIRT
jgi:hypothetical protein